MRKKRTGLRIPALRMDPTRGKFLVLAWAGKNSSVSQSMGKKGWNGIIGFPQSLGILEGKSWKKFGKEKREVMEWG